ncbi:threonine/serine exporter family protein [Bombilactobacillus bombi]|uniref:threonine/serine exporter family protein n=1 Tax=Bombilactobacillus bombi TaxID=1303590 RepID=UPI0013C2F489|nr:threonine/serine exporter family protein [Bombilactobacillus bombi]
MPILLQVLVQIAFSFIGTVGYAICVNIPRRALIGCGFCGMLGWMVYWFFWNYVTAGRVFSNLIAALVIGLVSYLLARIQKMPVTLFNIPALVPLVPGATAYEAVRAMVSGEFVNSIRLFLMVIMTIGAIAMGYMIAQVLIDIAKSIKE